VSLSYIYTLQIYCSLPFYIPQSYVFQHLTQIPVTPNHSYPLSITPPYTAITLPALCNLSGLNLDYGLLYYIHLYTHTITHTQTFMLDVINRD